MLSSAGEGRGGHERAHDPCRADRKEWTAEHPLPADPARVLDPSVLAPHTGSRGYSPYSLDGRAVQAAGLLRAMRTHRRRSLRLLGHALPALALVVVGGTLVLSVAAVLTSF
jgi:hypothetical protein